MDYKINVFNYLLLICKYQNTKVTPLKENGLNPSVLNTEQRDRLSFSKGGEHKKVKSI